MQTVTRQKTPGHGRIRVGIIGCGVVGTVLGVALSRCGYPVVEVMDRSEEAARKAAERIGRISASTDAVKTAKGSNCLFVTTPDDAIAGVCAAIAAGGGIGQGDIVYHCSGAFDADVLAPARNCGAVVASLHPLGVFADVESAITNLSKLYFCLEGDTEAVEMAERMTRDIGAMPVRVPKEMKTMTHVAACLASNYVVTLADMAVRLLENLRLPKEERLKLLVPLLQGAVRALREEGLPMALTGPLARGDVSTLQRHIQAVRGDETAARLYALLGLRTLPLAVEKGTLSPETAGMMEKLLRASLEESHGYS
jgi:predicted short-subunit dehydrogenase-like oxidoreductase (DUF2520 family)